MLTITRPAHAVIRRVTAHPLLAPTSGLRVFRPDRRGPMQVRAVKRPSPGDDVVEHDGGRLYLDPSAARHLKGQELDAEDDQDGRVQFILRDRS